MGSPESFDAYVAARYATLLRTAYLLTGNHHDAEDLVQTALVKAVGAWRRIGRQPRRLRATDPGQRERLTLAQAPGREVLTDRPARRPRRAGATA